MNQVKAGDISLNDAIYTALSFRKAPKARTAGAAACGSSSSSGGGRRRNGRRIAGNKSRASARTSPGGGGVGGTLRRVLGGVGVGTGSGLSPNSRGRTSAGASRRNGGGSGGGASSRSPLKDPSDTPPRVPTTPRPRPLPPRPTIDEAPAERLSAASFGSDFDSGTYDNVNDVSGGSGAASEGGEREVPPKATSSAVSSECTVKGFEVDDDGDDGLYAVAEDIAATNDNTTTAIDENADNAASDDDGTYCIADDMPPDHYDNAEALRNGSRSRSCSIGDGGGGGGSSRISTGSGYDSDYALVEPQSLVEPESIVGGNTPTSPSPTSPPSDLPLAAAAAAAVNGCIYISSDVAPRSDNEGEAAGDGAAKSDSDVRVIYSIPKRGSKAKTVAAAAAAAVAKASTTETVAEGVELVSEIESERGADALCTATDPSGAASSAAVVIEQSLYDNADSYASTKESLYDNADSFTTDASSKADTQATEGGGKATGRRLVGRAPQPLPRNAVTNRGARGIPGRNESKEEGGVGGKKRLPSEDAVAAAAARTPASKAPATAPPSVPAPKSKVKASPPKPKPKPKPKPRSKAAVLTLGVIPGVNSSANVNSTPSAAATEGTDSAV